MPLYKISPYGRDDRVNLSEQQFFYLIECFALRKILVRARQNVNEAAVRIGRKKVCWLLIITRVIFVLNNAHFL
ncbi:MAG: hypothetical protein COA54_10580 [Thiotrichaceae bacterium]|nr:MAG: hypothetical protein COA54_10580 [Thiotrichaceae bacterium]